MTLLKRSSVIQPSISKRSDRSFESLLTQLLLMLAVNFKTRLREKVLFTSANFHFSILGTLEIDSLHFSLIITIGKVLPLPDDMISYINFH